MNIPFGIIKYSLFTIGKGYFVDLLVNYRNNTFFLVYVFEWNEKLLYLTIIRIIFMTMIFIHVLTTSFVLSNFHKFSYSEYQKLTKNFISAWKVGNIFWLNGSNLNFKFIIYIKILAQLWTKRLRNILEKPSESGQFYLRSSQLPKGKLRNQSTKECIEMLARNLLPSYFYI